MVLVVVVVERRIRVASLLPCGLVLRFAVPLHQLPVDPARLVRLDYQGASRMRNTNQSVPVAICHYSISAVAYIQRKVAKYLGSYPECDQA